MVLASAVFFLVYPLAQWQAEQLLVVCGPCSLTGAGGTLLCAMSGSTLDTYYASTLGCLVLFLVKGTRILRLTPVLLFWWSSFSQNGQVCTVGVLR